MVEGTNNQGTGYLGPREKLDRFNNLAVHPLQENPRRDPDEGKHWVWHWCGSTWGEYRQDNIGGKYIPCDFQNLNFDILHVPSIYLRQVSKMHN